MGFWAYDGVLERLEASLSFLRFKHGDDERWDRAVRVYFEVLGAAREQDIQMSAGN